MFNNEHYFLLRISEHEWTRDKKRYTKHFFISNALETDDVLFSEEWNMKIRLYVMQHVN